MAIFSQDVKLGRKGEKFMCVYLSDTGSEGWRVVDVTGEKYFRDRDIDVLHLSEDFEDKWIYDGRFDYYDKYRCEHLARSYEVKTDTYIAKTRNAVLEVMIKNDRLGYVFKCTADFIVYLALDERSDKITDMWFVNLAKWRHWASEHEDDPNRITKVTKPNNDGNRLLLNCNIDMMVKDGIAVKRKVPHKDTE